MNRAESYSDVEFYGCFSNHHSIKEFWNMSETYVAKATRKFKMRKVPCSKMFYIHTNLIEDKLEVQRDYPYPKKLKNKKEKIHLLNEQIIPQDFMFDHPSEPRIGVRIIYGSNIYLMDMINEFTK
jgi:hypothetical protein